MKVTLYENTKSAITLTEIFEPENINALELQRGGWQAILDNFKKFVENS